MSHAPEDLLRFECDIVHPDAFGLNCAGLERVGSIIVAAGDREKQFVHCASFLFLVEDG